MVKAIGDYLLANVDEISQLLSLEGKPLWEAVMEIEGAARYFEYYGNQAETLEGRSIPLGDGYYDFTTYEPRGVSGQIIPWNYPMEMTARGVAAALTTGNTVVVKSPELDPLTHHYYALAAEAAGFPAGAVNIVCGLGHEAGAALSSHKGVDQLVFTGSVPPVWRLPPPLPRMSCPVFWNLAASQRPSFTTTRTLRTCSIASGGAFSLTRAKSAPRCRG